MPDGFGNGIAVLQNIAVPEAWHSETLLFQISVTPFVVLAFGMLRAIGFDDQPLIKIEEIYDVAVNDNLPPEFETSHSFGPQNFPKTLFSFCRVETHPFCAGE